MDVVSLLVILGITGIGLYLRWNWLVVIGVFLLLAFAFVNKPKAKTKSGAKVKLRPIIVKRKYDVTSIYPNKMEFYTTTFSPPDWWEAALNTFGKLTGRLVSGKKGS